jgi:chromosome segregation ATPase
MKRLLLILTLVCFANIGWAKQVTRDQALRQAQMFLSQKGLPGSLTSAETQMSRRRAQGIVQPECYYVFNAGMDQGFVIVSGDDRVETVLGYSTSGHFDVDNIPPAMADLLNYYAAQIEAIRNGAPVAARRASHNYLPDLMTVKWAQNEPYNNKTPLGYYSNVNEGVHCVAGCVATAMAQVLYHQHFVDATQATIPGYKNYYYWQPPSGKKTAYLSEIPSGSALEWNNMVDNYETQTTTQEQKDAVANLMLYCGTAVNMKYNIRGSSAPVSAIPDAFKSYFGYSRGTRYVSRSVYSDSEWDDLIYNEIYLGRPVIYGGQTANDEGHAFIVHGYDGDGRYSINWGWGGFQDNYFYLSDLTPPEQGTGGGSGGYNYGQEAVINLSKEDGSFSETVKATVIDAGVGNVDFSNFVIPTGHEYVATRNSRGRVTLGLAFTYTSNLANPYTFDLGYGVINSQGSLVGKIESFSGTISLDFTNSYTPATGTSNFGANLSEGTYYIKAYSRESGTSDWLLCDDADKHAVKIVVEPSTMSFTVVDISTFIPEPEPEVSDADRSELTNTYTSLKSSVEAKKVAVAENEATITALKTAINEKKQSITTIEASIASINTKLTNDSYLSESQKNDFLTQLTTLNNQLVQLKNDLSALESTLTTLESTNASLKTQLNELLSRISEQLGSIAGITTKEALNASKALAAQLTTTGNGYDVNEVTTQILGVGNSLNGITFTNMQTSLSDLDKAVDKAIVDAEAAALEEQEKKELEAAKASMEETVEGISKSALDKVAAVEANTKTIADLKAAINTASESAKTVADKITAIKSKLGNTLLTDAQKSEFLSKLDELENELKAFEASLSELTTQLSEAESSNALLKTKLDEAKNSITELKASIDAATKKSEVEALNINADAIKSLVDGVDVAALTTNLGTIETKQKVLSTESITTALSDLDKAVDKAIADAEAAALEEQEKKELEAAKTSMKEIIEGISKSALDKAAAVEANTKTIADLKVAINTASESAKTVSDKITAIKSKLGNTLLTDAQKSEFLSKLDELENELKTYEASLSELTTQLSEVESSNTLLKTKLDEAKNSITELTASIDAATKKSEVEALNTNADVIKSLVDGVDVATLTTSLGTIETKQKALSTESITTALSDLDKAVDKAIADAETAALEEQERKELEAAKAGMKETIEVISKSASDKEDVVEANNKSIDALKTTIASALETAKSVSDKIAEIKTLLEDKYISESQKKENLLKLVMIYEKELEDYQESLEIVSSKLGDAEKSNASFATKLEEMNKAIADLIVKVDVATKKDDVEALKPETEVIKSHLDGVDITSISKDLDALAEQLKTLSLSDTSTALAELQKVIQDLIDTAKSDEEKEKQEAEKLAKAKEDCQSAIQTLEGTIESQEADYEKCMNVLNILKAKLSEIDNAISQMKVEYTEIEKKLQELIDMQSDTRADNSEIIENLKKKLETLNSNIIILESQRDLISGQIEQLEDAMQIYDSLIKKAIDIRNQLPTLLASATAIDDVESMTRLATLAFNELSSDGVDVFNQYVGIYNVVRDNMSILIDNVNIVYNQANSLQSEVENELTAINQLIIDETEVVARYDMKGNRVDSTYKGVQIIRLKNGKIIKLNVK